MYHQTNSKKTFTMNTQQIAAESKKQIAVSKMKKAIAAQSTEMLKDVAKKLMTNFEEGAAIVFCFTLDELEQRMSESEYVEFCDNLN